jgi:hypothetical protein
MFLLLLVLAARVVEMAVAAGAVLAASVSKQAIRSPRRHTLSRLAQVVPAALAGQQMQVATVAIRLLTVSYQMVAAAAAQSVLARVEVRAAAAHTSLRPPVQPHKAIQTALLVTVITVAQVDPEVELMGEAVVEAASQQAAQALAHKEEMEATAYPIHFQAAPLLMEAAEAAVARQDRLVVQAQQAAVTGVHQAARRAVQVLQIVVVVVVVAQEASPQAALAALVL